MWHLILFILLFSDPSGDLVIEITGIKKPEGLIRVGVYQSDSTFLKRPFRFADHRVSGSESQSIIIRDVPYGTLAVSIYHDINGNHQLDGNFLGIPKEPYGFSNDARGWVGPPDFEDAAFTHRQSQTKIRIKL